METTPSLIHDRGRGPELIGTRITVYNLLPYLLDPSATEEYICKASSLTREQVAAARAYILLNPDTVLAQHMRIEDRMAAGNPPEVVERMKQAHETFMRFRQWLKERQAAEEAQREVPQSNLNRPDTQSFREWITQQPTNVARER